MIEEGVAHEIVFITVVATDEYERQRPDRGRAIGVIERIFRVVYEDVGAIVPATQMSAESSGCLFRQFDEDCFDPNFDSGAVSIQILPAVKIVLVYDGPTKDPLRSEDEIECLA